MHSNPLLHVVTARLHTILSLYARSYFCMRVGEILFNAFSYVGFVNKNKTFCMTH